MKLPKKIRFPGVGKTPRYANVIFSILSTVSFNYSLANLYVKRNVRKLSNILIIFLARSHRSYELNSPKKSNSSFTGHLMRDTPGSTLHMRPCSITYRILTCVD